MNIRKIKQKQIYRVGHRDNFAPEVKKARSKPR